MTSNRNEVAKLRVIQSDYYYIQETEEPDFFANNHHLHPLRNPTIRQVISFDKTHLLSVYLTTNSFRKNIIIEK